MPKATSTPNASAATESQSATKPRRERSTNYPAHTIREAIAKAEAIWKLEKRVPVSSQIAAEHMGFRSATSGASAPLMSSLRKYGIIESVANGEIRVSEDASVVYIYPSDSPEHMAALKRLAMRPSIFNEVLKEFPDGLPSDQSLRAKLIHHFGFASTEAADTFIRTLRAALAVGVIDGAGKRNETGGTAIPREEAAMPQTETITPAATNGPPTVGGGHVVTAPGQERHAWKLGNGVWAEITITGTLSAKRLAKLKGYIDLLDAEDDDEGGGEPE